MGRNGSVFGTSPKFRHDQGMSYIRDARTSTVRTQPELDIGPDLVDQKIHVATKGATKRNGYSNSSSPAWWCV